MMNTLNQEAIAWFRSYIATNESNLDKPYTREQISEKNRLARQKSDLERELSMRQYYGTSKQLHEIAKHKVAEIEVGKAYKQWVFDDDKIVREKVKY